MKTVTINDIRGNLLNSVEIPDDTPKDQEIKVALEKLVQLRVSLEGANLYRANLQGANLERAIIKEGVTLLKGGYFTVTNIGSKQETLEVFNTEVGLYFRRGCFFGNEEEFRAAVTEKHGNNKYAKMYLLQIDYAKIKFNI